MRKHLITIQASGPFSLEHTKALVAAASKLGLQIHHASVHHEGHTHITHGTPSDLTEALEALGKTISAPSEGQGETLETATSLLKEVRDGQSEIIRLLNEKKVNAPKPPKEKRKGPEGKPEEELLQDVPTGKPPLGEGSGSGADDKKAAEGGDAADGQSGHELETNGPSETTTQTDGTEG